MFWWFIHFKLVFPFLNLFDEYEFPFHVYVHFAKTLRYTCIPLESFAFHANLYLWTQLCLGICMYTSCVDNSYIYLEMKICFNKNLVFHAFMYLCLNFMYMSILSKLLLYIYILLSHVPSCIYLCGLVVFGYVCIL